VWTWNVHYVIFLTVLKLSKLNVTLSLIIMMFSSDFESFAAFLKNEHKT